MNYSSHLNQILILKSIIILLIASNFPSSRCQVNEKFTLCRRTPYECGDIKDVSFPFFGAQRPDYCGQPGFELSCSKENESMIAGHQLRVENISQVDRTSRVNITWLDTENGPCSQKLPPFETTLSSIFMRFTYPPTVEILTFYYNCSAAVAFQYIKCGDNYVHYANDSLPSETDSPLCSRSVVPVFRSALDNRGVISFDEDKLKVMTEVLKQGFEVDFTLLPLCQACKRSGGECGYNTSIPVPSFRCFCRDGDHKNSCPTRGRGGPFMVKMFIGIYAWGITVLLFCIVCCVCKIRSSEFWSKITKKDQDIEAFLRNNGDLPVRRYRFSDVKKMTKFFKDKLGQGGYGEVYKGKLHDGRFVAVKLLKSSKGNGDVTPLSASIFAALYFAFLVILGNDSRGTVVKLIK